VCGLKSHTNVFRGTFGTLVGENSNRCPTDYT